MILVPFRQTSDSSVTFRLCLTTRMSNSFEPFHPRRWLRVCSPGRAEGGEEMEVVFSTGVANRVRVAGVLLCEGWSVL